jgi:hypothetical protein
MLNILLLATVASILFMNHNSKNIIKTQKTYKMLIKDLMEHHDVTHTHWKDNLKINNCSDGIMIGSDNGFVHLSDSNTIKLHFGKNKIDLDTSNVNESIDKIKEMLKSEVYNDSDKKIISNILKKLYKYQNHYYLKKYLKYKNLYINLNK